LFFADLALRGAHPSSVLPDYDAVIFDEAHQIEDVATEYFSLSVSSARVARLVSDTARLLERELGAAASEAQRIGQLGEALFDAIARVLPSNDGRSPLTPEIWAGEVEECWFALDTALEVLSGRIAVVCDARAAERSAGYDERSAYGHVAGNERAAATETEALLALVRRAGSLREDLASIARGTPGRVVWFESAARSRKLSASPVELSQILQERLFAVTPAVVLTSATLTSGAASSSPSSARSARPSRDVDPELGPESWPDPDAAPAPSPLPSGPFGFQRRRLGLTLDHYRVDELTLRSPFDFESQALLYL